MWSSHLEAKQCEKGSEKFFFSKRNKGLVSLISLRSEAVIFMRKGNGHKAKNSEMKQTKRKY
jgi:hypothetical protein